MMYFDVELTTQSGSCKPKEHRAIVRAESKKTLQRALQEPSDSCKIPALKSKYLTGFKIITIPKSSNVIEHFQLKDWHAKENSQINLYILNKKQDQDHWLNKCAVLHIKKIRKPSGWLARSQIT